MPRQPRRRSQLAEQDIAEGEPLPSAYLTDAEAVLALTTLGFVLILREELDPGSPPFTEGTWYVASCPSGDHNTKVQFSFIGADGRACAYLLPFSAGGHLSYNGDDPRRLVRDNGSVRIVVVDPATGVVTAVRRVRLDAVAARAIRADFARQLDGPKPFSLAAQIIEAMPIVRSPGTDGAIPRSAWRLLGKTAACRPKLH